MTDNELRGMLLNWYYERRRDGDVRPEPEDFGGKFNELDITRISRQLYEHDLIVASFVSDSSARPFGDLFHARISAHGIDVIEGESQSSIAISIDNRHIEDSRTFNISDSSGFQIGDHNTQNFTLLIRELATQIDRSDAPDTEKKEAKRRLVAFLQHPLIVKVFGEVLTRVPSLHEISDLGAA